MKKLLLALLFVASAHAAEPLKIIVTYAAGGNTDLAARVYAKELARQGVETLVINKPGAEGLIGMQELMAAKPDGNTVMYSGKSAVVTNSAINPAAYEIMTKITPIMRGAANGYMVISRKDSDIRTIEQLKSALKTRTVAVGVNGTETRIAFEELLGNNSNLILVSYNGDNAVMLGLMNKSIEIGAVTFLLEDRVTSGELNGLAVLTPKGRSGMKSLVELGYNISQEGWTGFWAPPGTTKETRDRLYNMLESVRVNEEVQKQIVTVVHAGVPRKQTPDEFARDIEREYQRAVKLLPNK
jgi:tripartite-type tricarboxylate transporter receptor subunit TctC